MEKYHIHVTRRFYSVRGRKANVTEMLKKVLEKFDEGKCKVLIP